MKKKVKHRLSVILSTILASTLILSGCGNSGSESGASKSDKEVTTIKYYNWDNEAQPGYDRD